MDFQMKPCQVHAPCLLKGKVGGLHLSAAHTYHKAAAFLLSLQAGVKSATVIGEEGEVWVTTTSSDVFDVIVL